MTNHSRFPNLSVSFCSSHQSSYVVFLVAGLILVCVFGLIILEKMSFLPKQLVNISAFASNNKVMHQVLAATNVLTLFACVLVPVVSQCLFPNFGMVFLTAVKSGKLRKAHCSPPLFDEDNSMEQWLKGFAVT